MTAGSTPIQQASSGGVQLALAIVLATVVVLGGLLVAAQAGMLPKSPTYAGAVPADQYLSPQTLGERAADR